MYNEPLFDNFLLQRIVDVKTALPDCYVQFNSNGDKLTPDYLEELWSVGLDQILITLHPGANKDYKDEEREHELLNYLSRLQLEPLYAERRMTEGKNITVETIQNGHRLLICCNNWYKYGTDRGGMIDYLSIKNAQDRVQIHSEKFLLLMTVNLNHAVTHILEKMLIMAT